MRLRVGTVDHTWEGGGLPLRPGPPKNVRMGKFGLKEDDYAYGSDGSQV